MREMGLQAVYPQKHFTAKNKEHKIYPYLLRDMEINKVDQVWVSYIIYIPLRHGNAYLTAIMDWHSCYVIPWELSIAMDSTFCVNALKNTFEESKPLIFNIDQGSKYTSNNFTEVLKENRIWMSMSGKGRAFDNIMIERLWRTVKYVEIYLTEYENYFAAYDALEEYFEYYNNARRHSSLSKRTPREVYFNERDASNDAAQMLIPLQ